MYAYLIYSANVIQKSKKDRIAVQVAVLTPFEE